MGEKLPTLSHEEPFFCPLDFTFVCPSEIIAFDERLDEFTARNAAVVGVSVDSAYTHLAWKKTPVEKGGIGTEFSRARDRNFLAGGADGGNPAPAELKEMIDLSGDDGYGFR